MALIKCPECDLQVSDSAMMCPHCGYLLNAKMIKNIPRKSNRKKRLPNGFGQITKLKNPNLRKPYRAMVTVGKTKYGKCITKLLKPESYFSSYNDAYAALVEYHKNPYDINKDITVNELYEKWSLEHFKELKSNSAIRNIKASWKYAFPLYDMKIRDIRVNHIKGCIENAYILWANKKLEASSNTKQNLKSTLNMMFDYAMTNDIVEKNYARLYRLPKKTRVDLKQVEQSHIDFSDEEIKKLWDHLYDIEYVDVVLIQCYSGWRPQELGMIKVENVDLKNWFFTGGMKTDAGKDRLVPIHPKIRDLVECRYKEAIAIGSDYLINCISKKNQHSILSYEKYRYRFKKIVEQLNLNPDHRTHDGRVHFITKAKEYKLNEYAIKYIVGHSIDDITEATYTKRKPEWLMQEILKIK